MKKSLSIIACVLAIFAAVSCSNKSVPAEAAWEPKTAVEKYYYCFGYFLGTNYGAASSDFDFKAASEGLRSAGDGSFKYNDQELQKIISDYQEIIQKQAAAQGAENLKKAQAFLEKNRKEDGVYETSSGLQYKILSQGDGKSPTVDSVVTVEYSLYDMDMNLIESTDSTGRPASFPLSNVIKGFREGLLMMKVGEQCRLFVSPELGYGSNGTSNVPANSLLIFDIRLISID